jgi:hypothetical protein
LQCSKIYSRKTNKATHKAAPQRKQVRENRNNASFKETYAKTKEERKCQRPNQQWPRKRKASTPPKA